MLDFKNYISVKAVKAVEMTLGEYNTYRGWKLPDNENPDKEGYLVEYPPAAGEAPNHPEHKGYISWTPALQFHLSSLENRGTEGFFDAVGNKQCLMDHAITTAKI